MPFVDVGGARIEYERIERGRTPTIVLLHEGLGSVAMWRDFPAAVARAPGHDVLAYSRQGYGRSSPLRGARPVRFMHDEALVVLPRLLDALAVSRPVLLGHSDGASIAIVHSGGSGRAVAGLVLLAPHVMVEEVTVASIAAARRAYETQDLRARLSRYHDDVDGAFRGWNDVWLAPEFRAWNVEEYLPAITCPILAIQGGRDEYGTMEQIDRIERAARDVEPLALPGAGHSAHRDCPAEVLGAVGRFVSSLPDEVR